MSILSNNGTSISAEDISWTILYNVLTFSHPEYRKFEQRTVVDLIASLSGFFGLALALVLASLMDGVTNTLSCCFKIAK